MLVPVPEYLRQPAAYFHTRILVGPGAFLTPKYAFQRGITHVINCAYSIDSPAWFRTKYPDRYVCLNAPDSPLHRILDWYPAFEEALFAFLRSPLGGVVYVHCQAGINRSAFLALTYVCHRFHMDGETMLESFQRQRPCMFENTVYRGQVLRFLNGRVSGAEDTGKSIRTANDGNSGFGASGCGSNLARLDDDTGGTPDGSESAQV